jgi:hypothetical protein
MKSCSNCKFCIYQDVGYSNYTVEGTDVYCAKELHPNDGFDRFYERANEMKFAEQCTGYEFGDPVKMDVEKEDYSSLSDDEKVVWLMRFSEVSR